MIPKILPFTLILLGTLSLQSQNNVPEIENLSATVDPLTSTVTINYDISDAEESELEISLFASDNGGISFSLDTDAATGDIGFPVSLGAGKQIIWNYADDNLTEGTNYILKLVADDRIAIDIQELVDQVDSNQLIANMEIIEGIRHRTGDPIHLEEVRDQFTSLIAQYQLEDWSHPFTWNGLSGINIVGRHPGHTQTAKVIIIGGHYDTVFNSPGADDNGSAVAGTWEAMRILSNYSFEKTIKFIGFDLEEDGLIGSREYVEEEVVPSVESVEGMFNLEMIGYYDDSPNSQSVPAGFDFLFPEVYQALVDDQFRGNFINTVSNTTSAPLAGTFEGAAAQYVPALKVLTIVASDNSVPSDLRRSDHASFWDADKPALMLTDGANFRNPHYHSPADLIETLDFNFMTNVVKATLATAILEAGIMHSSAATTTVDIPVGTIEALNCKFSIQYHKAANQLQVTRESCFEKALQLEVWSLNGQRFYEASNLLELQNITTSQWPAGIYLIKVFNEEQSYVQKVVIP